MLQRRVGIIDIDGVLTCTCPTAVNALRDREGLSPVSMPADYHLGDYYAAEREYCYRAFRRSELYELCEPFDGAAEAVTELAQKFDLCYLTARTSHKGETINDNSIVDVTIQWLRQHRFPEAPTCFLEHGQNKLDVARQHYGADVAFIVEDNLDTANSFADAGIPAFVVRYPYNYLPTYIPGVVGVGSVKDVPFWVDVMEIGK